MSDIFYVISTGEDTRIEVLSAETLKSRLDEEYYGDNKFIAPAPGKSMDLAEVSGLIIIKGKAIKPKPVETVTKWDVD